MKLAIASDHAGLTLKTEVLSYLKQKKIDVLDLGVNDTSSVDYPDYAEKVASQVSEKKVDAGILICGTGVGMCITANKFKGVRAAVVSDVFSAKMSREHNDANVLCFGARVVDEARAKEIVDTWLGAKFEGGRHQGRVKKMSDWEKKNFR